MAPTTCANSTAPGETSLGGSSQTADRSSAPTVQWSSQQMDALFAIAQQKAEQELQAITAKVRRDDEESQARI